MGIEDFEDSSGTHHKVDNVMLRRVLSVIASKGVSYPSEISNRTPYKPAEVGDLCRRCEKAGVLQRVHPQQWHPRDPRIRKRLPMLVASDLDRETICHSINWYGFPVRTDKGSRIAFKVAGEHKFIDPVHRDVTEEAMENPHKFVSDFLGWAERKVVEVP